MKRNVIALATLCAWWISGCGDIGADAAKPTGTSGDERVAVDTTSNALDTRPMRDVARIPTLGRGIVASRGDASYALPSMADPLDQRRVTPQTGPIRIHVCPAGLPGLAAQAIDLPQGAALELRAQADGVDDLRARMERFVLALRGTAPGDLGILSESSVRMVMIEGGARLEALSGDEALVGALRSQLRDDAQLLDRGLCPMSLQLEA